jgi:glycosyltransferase involved in cell wall biosynthesis
MPQPLVSCLMVTARRTALAERAVQCFCNQTWANKELLIIDDGDDDYTAMLQPYRAQAEIRYDRVGSAPRLLLGGLRNLSLERSRGEYCTQWDDDEWYHPQRIESQMNALASEDSASVLRYTLMHIDQPGLSEHPYRTGLRRGTPGTLLHRRSAVRYPNQGKGEDSRYLQHIRRGQSVAIMGTEFSHLFIRCYHGQNTWDRRHFIERLWYTSRDKIEYVRARYLRGDLWSHAAFQLTAQEQASIQALRTLNHQLGLDRD